MPGDGVIGGMLDTGENVLLESSDPSVKGDSLGCNTIHRSKIIKKEKIKKKYKR